jgi:malonyl-CoA O-methyltransferase
MISEKKQTISRKFSRAAETYDSFSHVQKESAARLAKTLSPLLEPAKILELGCGTGNYTGLLSQKYPSCELWAIDFSQAMVDHARKKLGEDTNLHFLCTDGEEFLASRKISYDLITSNATLQWFEDLDSCFRHAAATLSAQGLFHISLFGPETLSELSMAYQEALQVKIDLPASFFASMTEIKNTAEKYFKEVRCEEQYITRQYDSLPDLLRHIQKTGAGGFQQSMPVLTKSRLSKINDWFVARGGHVVKYQVIYLMAS